MYKEKQNIEDLKNKDESFNILKLEFKEYIAGFEYTYDRVEKDNDEYNRNSTLENVKISSINLQKLTEFIIDSFTLNKKNKIVNYCVNRIANSLVLTDFEAEISKGYYGEEVKYFKLVNDEKIDQFNLFKKSPSFRWGSKF